MSDRTDEASPPRSRAVTRRPATPGELSASGRLDSRGRGDWGVNPGFVLALREPAAACPDRALSRRATAAGGVNAREDSGTPGESAVAAGRAWLREVHRRRLDRRAVVRAGAADADALVGLDRAAPDA